MNEIDYEKYSVLFVDDEIPVLKAVKRGLRLEKYNKYFASSGVEAQRQKVKIYILHNSMYFYIF